MYGDYVVHQEGWGGRDQWRKIQPSQDILHYIPHGAGDKTQLSCVVLAAGLSDPFGALVGIMLAFAAVTAIGVLSGAKILRLLPRRYLEIGAAILFIILGIIFILNSLTGIGLKLGI